uniref:Uncharacterized protein n=1 Tax=Arundo donax TaxID=35708 RepID=A0A0A8Y2K9_ARUDO
MRPLGFQTTIIERHGSNHLFPESLLYELITTPFSNNSQ